jgi:3-oxoacyl-[acyl-carrier protein] reductase
MMLQGARALVTGANQGFGYAVAKRFLSEGARVFLCARDEERLATAARSLQPDTGEDRVLWARADVSRPADVEALIKRAVAALGGLDVLVCNAGVYGPKGRIEDVDWEEWMHAISINLGGAILCCREALPHMRAQGRGKIILLSGGGATKPMPFMSAYAASKAALIRFGETLAEEVKGTGIDVNAIAPGALNTRLMEEVIGAGPDRVGRAFYEQTLTQKESGGTPLETGAALCAFLASSESDGITGRLISALWDPWQDPVRLRHLLAVSDMYTLRRIVPEDRNVNPGQPS